MNLHFYKYHGTGNDFILIDNRSQYFDTNNYKLVKTLCHRRFGIGADGLILLENSEGSDFYMRFYNSDGRPASMCGNGGRCIVAFAQYLGIIETSVTFTAPDGIHTATINDGKVALAMNDVLQIEQIGNDFYMNTGSPHYVRIIETHDNFDTVAEGRKIRYNRRFKSEGTNVNFVSFQENTIHLSTYERGVEDETYSCGTGTVAAAIVVGLLNNKEAHELHTKGGILNVSYEKSGESFKNIILQGAASMVFEGKYYL